MGEQNFWETYWFDKIILPTVLSIATTVLLIYVPRVFLKTRNSFGRRRAQKLIRQANAFIGSQTQNGTAVLMLMTLGNLIVEIAVLLIGVMITCTFFITSILNKTAGHSGHLLVVAILYGILISMIHNTWREVAAIALASMGPSQYLDQVDAKLGSIYRDEFRAELDVLRRIAEQNQKHQQGTYWMGVIAEGLILGNRQPPPSPSEPQTSDRTETEGQADRVRS